MTTLPLATFNSYLRQANTLLRGPAYIECKNDVDFYGSQTLTLGLIPSRVYQNESRSVYAPLDNSSQKSAILRAVFLDRNEERKKFLANREVYRLALPAKFVLIPQTQLQEWLNLFAHVDFVIGDKQDHRATSAIIRKLHIEWSPDIQGFGVTWSTNESTRNVLNPLWNQVWREMDHLLATGPVVHGLEERLFRGEMLPSYNLIDYAPTKLTSYLEDSNTSVH